MAAGRPTDYSEPTVNAFLSLVAEGHSVHKLCQRDDMPSKTSIFKWLSDYPEFAEKYYHAKRLSADSDADKIQEVSEDCLAGNVDPQAARVALIGLTWSAARKNARKYGDRLDLGNADSKPFEVIIK